MSKYEGPVPESERQWPAYLTVRQAQEILRLINMALMDDSHPECTHHEAQRAALEKVRQVLVRNGKAKQAQALREREKHAALAHNQEAQRHVTF